MSEQKNNNTVKYAVAISVIIIVISIIAIIFSSGSNTEVAAAASSAPVMTTSNSDVPSDRKGRYVRIERVDPSGQEASSNLDTLNISEVMVYDHQGNNLVNPTVTAWASSVLSNLYEAKNLIDGNLDNLAHTADGSEHWFMIDLGSVQDIARVDIVNRVGYEKRLIGARILIKKNVNDIVAAFASAPITEQQVLSNRVVQIAIN